MDPISWIRTPVALIARCYLPSYLVMNLIFYGCILVGMAIAAAQPTIHAQMRASLQTSLQGPSWAPVVNAYKGRHVLQAAAITLGVNLILGTALVISGPSLIVPFSGLLVGIFRGILWGLLFAPVSHESAARLVSTLPTMILEGQGYVLGMLSVYIHGKGVTRPASVGASGNSDGYRRGFVAAMRIYPLIALVLAIAAIVEACTVIFVLNKQN